jgi:hypothetical protein
MVKKNQNPGPGAHNVRTKDNDFTFPSKTMGSAGPAKALPDNGVPGPGTYQLP